MNIVQEFIQTSPGWAGGYLQDLAAEENPEMTRWACMRLLDGIRSAQNDCRRRHGLDGIAVATNDIAREWQRLEKLAWELYRKAEKLDAV